MKYWKKVNGECGTMDNDGYVPGSVEITVIEYSEYVAAQPVIIPEAEIIEYEDVDTEKRYRFRRIVGA